MNDQYLENVRRLIFQNLKDYALKVYLFGSRANWVARTGADCDIGIDPFQKLPVGLLSSIREKLEESTEITLEEVLKYIESSWSS